MNSTLQLLAMVIYFTSADVVSKSPYKSSPIPADLLMHACTYCAGVRNPVALQSLVTPLSLQE